MSSEDTKILEFDQYQKSHKSRFIISADLECIIEKTDGGKNSTESSSTKKASKHSGKVKQNLRDVSYKFKSPSYEFKSTS